ncbi:MAG: S41 family peptidase [Pseudomonadales bacterium]
MHLRPLILLGITASMVSGVALGVLGYRAWLAPPLTSDTAKMFDRVLTEVQASYVEDVPREDLVSNALRGMLRDLDRHSVFLEPKAWDTLKSETTGNFGGVGIELGFRDGVFTVVTPMSGTPAEAAGIRAGDRILEIDDTPVGGLALPEMVERLRGEPGSVVQLRIESSDDSAPRDVELVRDIIHINSVNARLLEPGYGYVRINQFRVETGDEFSAALAELAAKTRGPLKGLVLDLRNNPGGVLQASVAVADSLLDHGLIVYTQGRQPSRKIRFKAANEDELAGAPVVVLINGGSASAAEVVAGALQDHGRARLLGSRSYGKGSVQTVVEIDGEAAIKLTTAHYYTPKGRNIHEQGIEPDLPLEDDPSPEDDEAVIDQALSVLKAAGDTLQARS